MSANPNRPLENCCLQERMTPSTVDFRCSQASAIFRGRDNIIDLENHLDNLRCQQDLLLLADKSFENILLFHVIGTHIIAINATAGIVLLEICSK
jgi:hypothetical protein